VRALQLHVVLPTVAGLDPARPLLVLLQTIVSRNVDPTDSAVLTCGTIKGGHGYNIIADRVDVTGTCRSFVPATQALIIRRMEEVCAGVAATYGGQVELAYSKGYPATVNSHPEAVEAVRRAAAEVVGAGNTAVPQR
jgi:amidohydrolase